MFRNLLAICVFGALIVGPADARRICPLLCSGAHGTLWTPLNLGPLLVAWWDASDIPHIVFSGSNVVSWTDRKSGIVAAQATGANQPVWSATARNGKPGLACNGTTQSLLFPTTLLPLGGATRSVFVAGFDTSGTNGHVLGYGSGAPAQWIDISAASTTSFAVAAGLFSGDINSTVNWANVDRIVEFFVSPGANQLFVDGATAGTNASTANTTGANGLICAAANGGGLFNGTVQQVVITTTVLSTNARQCTEGWESWYDGKAGANLPIANPYSATGTLHRAPMVTDNCT